MPGGLHYVASAYVVHGNRVLLIHHRALGRWLAPGGHIDRSETPDACAVREVWEETGVRTEIIDGEQDPSEYAEDGVQILPRPMVVQLEDIDPPHRHVDFVYVGVAETAELAPASREVTCARWFERCELQSVELPPNVRLYASRALDLVERERAVERS